MLPTGVYVNIVDSSARIILPPIAATAKVLDSATAEMPLRRSYTFAHWAVVLVRAGEGAIRHSGVRYPFHAGTLICAPPGFVTIECPDEPEMIVISLEERGSGITETWRPFSVVVKRQLDGSGVARWSERLLVLERKISTGTLTDADVLALKHAFAECFWLAPRVESQRLVNDVFAAMHRSMDRISTLEDLAADLGYTRNHLNDLAHDLTGASLGAWLSGMRMARARDALASTDMPIALVGATIGYDDAAYFSRAFRRYHGVPPQHWRIAHRPDDVRRPSIVGDFDDLREIALDVA